MQGIHIEKGELLEQLLYQEAKMDPKEFEALAGPAANPRKMLKSETAKVPIRADYKLERVVAFKESAI
jgi:hypothetical protein